MPCKPINLIAVGLFISANLILSGSVVGQHAGDVPFKLIRSYGSAHYSHTGPIKNVQVVDAGHVLSCSDDGTIALWNLKTEQWIRRYDSESSETLFCLAVTADKKYLLAGGGNKIVLQFDIQTGEQIKSYNVESQIYSIDLCPDQETFLVGSSDGKITHWKLSADESIRTYNVDKDKDIISLKCLPDGTGFITGDDKGSVSVWEFGKDKPVKKKKRLDSYVCCLKISDDQTQIAASDYQGTVVLWERDTLKQIWISKKVAEEISWIEFLDDQTLLAVDGTNHFFKIDLKTGKHTVLPIDMPDAAGFAISADRRSIYTGGRYQLTGWDIEKGTRIFPADDNVYHRAGPISQMLLQSEIIYTIGDQPVIQGSDLKTGEIVYQQKLRFDRTMADDDEITSTDVGMFSLGNNIGVSLPKGYAELDTKKGDYELTVKQPRLSKIQRVPTGDKLLGLDENKEQIQEFSSAKSRSRKILSTENMYGFEFYPLEQQFILITNSETLRITATKSGDTISMKKIPDFYFRNTVVAGGTIVSTNGEKLIGFSSTPLSTDPNLNQQSINQLVQQLAAPQFNLREQATLKLAGGGQTVLDQLESLTIKDIESQARVRQIRHLIEYQGIPNLNLMATTDLKIANEGSIETITVHPQGDYWLATSRKNWKSILHSGRIVEGKFVDLRSQPLRSRANTIQFSDDGKYFYIGNADGSIDQFEAATRPANAIE